VNAINPVPIAKTKRENIIALFLPKLSEIKLKNKTPNIPPKYYIDSPILRIDLIGKRYFKRTINISKKPFVTIKFKLFGN
jgi:hypothetical protein